MLPRCSVCNTTRLCFKASAPMSKVYSGAIVRVSSPSTALSSDDKDGQSKSMVLDEDCSQAFGGGIEVGSEQICQ